MPERKRGSRNADGLGWVAAATLGTGLPAMAWGLYAFGQGGQTALPGAMAIAIGGLVGAAGMAVAFEAASRSGRGGRRPLSKAARDAGALAARTPEGTIDAALSAVSAEARDAANALADLCRDDDGPASVATARFVGLADAAKRRCPVPGRAVAVLASLSTALASAARTAGTIEGGSRRNASTTRFPAWSRRWGGHGRRMPVGRAFWDAVSAGF